MFLLCPCLFNRYLCFVLCHNNHILSSLGVYLFVIHNMTWHLIVSLSAQSLSLFSFALWTHNNRHKNSQTTEYYFRFGRVLWSMAASLHTVCQTRHMLSVLAAQRSNNCSGVDTVKYMFEVYMCLFLCFYALHRLCQQHLVTTKKFLPRLTVLTLSWLAY